MAKMIGDFSHIKGKIGNMIYATWHGVQVIKTMFIPANPQSADQTSHRDIFAQIVAIGLLINDDIISVCWDPFRTKANSGWSNFMKYNLIIQTGATLDYDSLCICRGSIMEQEIESAVFVTGTGVATIVFSAFAFTNQDVNDLCGALMINDTDDNVWYNAEFVVERKDGTITIQGRIGDTPADLHGYIWFIRKDGTLVISASGCGPAGFSAP